MLPFHCLLTSPPLLSGSGLLARHLHASMGSRSAWCVDQSSRSGQPAWWCLFYLLSVCLVTWAKPGHALVHSPALRHVRKTLPSSNPPHYRSFGPWRKAAEDFLASFAPSYCLKEKRIGSPGVWAGNQADTAAAHMHCKSNGLRLQLFSSGASVPSYFVGKWHAGC